MAAGVRRDALMRHPAGVFFALAALIAVALPWIWLLPIDDPRLTHLRLGMFGFGGAAVTGYLLTAQKAWTGRDAPLPAPVLGALTLAARLASLVWAGSVLPVALPLLVPALAVLWPVVATRRWARLPLASVPLALVFAETGVVRGWLSTDLVPVAMAALVLAVGGRAVPAFLAAERPRSGAAIGSGAGFWIGPVLLTAGLALPGAAGWLGYGAAALWVLSRLRGGLRAGPANRMLSLAYAGLVPALLALAAADAGLTADVVVRHLITMAVMGPMIMAFAARASMRRLPDRRLLPTARHWLGFWCILAAAALRVAAEIAADTPLWLALAGAFWSGGWLVFLAVHAAALPRPAPFPVLSAARAPQAAS